MRLALLRVGARYLWGLRARSSVLPRAIEDRLSLVSFRLRSRGFAEEPPGRRRYFAIRNVKVEHDMQLSCLDLRLACLIF